MHQKPRFTFMIAATAAALITVAGCSAPAADDGASDAPAVETATVQFALPVSTPDAGQVVAYMPTYLGVFEEEQLEVEIIPNDGGTAALQQVATGNADFSVNNPQAVMNAVAQGLPVVAVANLYPRQIYGFYVLEGSEITSFDDLMGKKVGISKPTSGSYPFALAGLAEHGLDPQSDVEMVTTGSGGPMLEALRNGDVDAVATWDTQVATFTNMGASLVALPDTALANAPADLLVVNADFLRENPDVVERFGRALLKSIAHAVDNPEDALEAFLSEYPESAAGLTEEENMTIVQARLDTLRMDAGQGPRGDIDMQGYEMVQRIGLEFGEIDKEQDLSALFDTSLLKAMQNF